MATTAPINIRIRKVKAKLLAGVRFQLDASWQKREMYRVTILSIDIAITAMNMISKTSARGKPNKFVGIGVDDGGSGVGVDIPFLHLHCHLALSIL